MSTRTERVEQLLRIEISDILRREIKDPRLGFVTITDVEVTKDLRQAKVFVSVMGDEHAKADSLIVLQRTAGFIRGEFGRRAHLKIIPEITFKMDSAIAHGSRIFEILQQVEHKDEE